MNLGQGRSGIHVTRSRKQKTEEYSSRSMHRESWRSSKIERSAEGSARVCFYVPPARPLKARISFNERCCMIARHQDECRVEDIFTNASKQ